MLMIGGGYVYGIITELEYPHWWTLRRVADARVESGQRVRAVLQQAFGASAENVHWHTCSYNGHARTAAGETHVQFRDPRGSQITYEFIYTSATDTLRPANRSAVNLIARGGS
jgi:hypothetical protein